MGKIVISENISLDGAVRDDMGRFDRWFGEMGGKEREAWARAELEEASAAAALLMGRRTYEWFVGRGWQSRAGEWADRMRSLPKHVVSATLEDLEWDNSTVLRGDVVKEVSQLKQLHDGDIVVYGSSRLGHTLMEEGLVDELRLMVCPFVLGGGQRIFGETSDLKPMRLVGTRTVGECFALLVYQPVRDV
jgi:dihydrofolate reductase